MKTLGTALSLILSVVTLGIFAGASLVNIFLPFILFFLSFFD